MAGLLLNLTFHRDEVLLEYAQVLRGLVDEVTDEGLVGEVVKCLRRMLGEFGERVLEVVGYAEGLKALIRSNMLL